MSLSARIAAMYSVSPKSVKLDTGFQDEEGVIGLFYNPQTGTKLSASRRSSSCDRRRSTNVVRFLLPSEDCGSSALGCPAETTSYTIIQGLPRTTPSPASKSSLRSILKYTHGAPSLPYLPIHRPTSPSTESETDSDSNDPATPLPDDDDDDNSEIAGNEACQSVEDRDESLLHRDRAAVCLQAWLRQRRRLSIPTDKSGRANNKEAAPALGVDPTAQLQQRHWAAARLIQRVVRGWYHRQLVRVARLEEALQNVEHRRQEELRDIQMAKVRQIRHLRGDGGHQEWQCLEAQARKNMEVVKELRRQNRKLQKERDEWSRQVTEMQAEHRQLISEQDLLKKQLEASRHAMAVYTATHDSWASAEQVLEEHLSVYQTMISEREALIEIEQRQRELYGKTLQSMVEHIGKHPRAATSARWTQSVWNEVTTMHPVAPL